MATLGQRLTLLRKEKNLSQTNLAKIVGSTRSSISTYELGSSEPPDSIKKKLADFFDVSVDYLCGFSDHRTFINYYKSKSKNFIDIPFIRIINLEKLIDSYISVDISLAPEGNCFFIISPDNYSEARILKNDTLLVKTQSSCDKNKLHLISIDNYLYLKSIHEYKNSYILANPSSEKNLIILPKESITIWGKVIKVIHNIDDI